MDWETFYWQRSLCGASERTGEHTARMQRIQMDSWIKTIDLHLLLQSVCRANQSRLGCIIAQCHGHVDRAAAGGDVDDAAAPLSAHAWKNGMDHLERLFGKDGCQSNENHNGEGESNGIVCRWEGATTYAFKVDFYNTPETVHARHQERPEIEDASVVGQDAIHPNRLSSAKNPLVSRL
jgi:hypothetical protein